MTSQRTPVMGEVWITEMHWPLTLLHPEPDGTGKYAWTSMSTHSPSPRYQLRTTARMLPTDEVGAWISPAPKAY